MFQNVIVSDDLISINKGVVTLLKELDVSAIIQVQYCDDAYLKIKKGILDQLPIKLLITDLSYKADYRVQKFPSGESLIKALKIECPDLKIIVYSVEDRLHKVRTLMNTFKVDAYVCKGRNGLSELKEAINLVYQNKIYLSPQLKSALNKKFDLEITDHDIEIMKLLSNGLSQVEIGEHFRKLNIKPSSLSSIEKHIIRLREHFKANNSIHLVSIVKDFGLI